MNIGVIFLSLWTVHKPDSVQPASRQAGVVISLDPTLPSRFMRRIFALHPIGVCPAPCHHGHVCALTTQFHPYPSSCSPLEEFQPIAIDFRRYVSVAHSQNVAVLLGPPMVIGGLSRSAAREESIHFSRTRLGRLSRLSTFSTSKGVHPELVEGCPDFPLRCSSERLPYHP